MMGLFREIFALTFGGVMWKIGKRFAIVVTGKYCKKIHGLTIKRSEPIKNPNTKVGDHDAGFAMARNSW